VISSYFYNVDLSVIRCVTSAVRKEVLLVGSKLDPPQPTSSQMKSLQGMFGDLNKIENHNNGSINGIL
jgi:hypothetical protein